MGNEERERQEALPPENIFEKIQEEQRLRLLTSQMPREAPADHGDGFHSPGEQEGFLGAILSADEASLVRQKMSRMDGIQALVSQRGVALADMKALYETLERTYSDHGGCGCAGCQHVELQLQRIREFYHFPDRLKRSGMKDLYFRVRKTPAEALVPVRRIIDVVLKAVELAEVHGFPTGMLMMQGGSTHDIIFNHTFVKAIWPSAWMTRLPEMVLCEEPYRYLDTFLYAEWGKPDGP